MLKEMMNLLKGEVTARVESGFPERVLNLCGEYGLTFWDLRWENAAAFTFTLTRRDWKRLRRLTAKLDCELTPLGWRGTPFPGADALPLWPVGDPGTELSAAAVGLLLYLGY